MPGKCVSFIVLTLNTPIIPSRGYFPFSVTLNLFQDLLLKDVELSLRASNRFSMTLQILSRY